MGDLEYLYINVNGYDMERFKLDVMITGSSRPQLLVYLLESLDRFVISQSKNTDFRIFLHEDFVIPKKSRKSIEIAKKYGVKVISHNPPIGMGPAIEILLNDYVETKYVLKLEDDWEFERTGIDIDRIIWTMNKFDEINCVIFNKARIGSHVGKLTEECNFNGMILTLWKSWSFIPSIWRVSIAREKWQLAKGHQGLPAGNFFRQFGKHIPHQDNHGAHHMRCDCDKCIKKQVNFYYKHVGGYFYGSLQEPRWVRHLGSTWKTLEWSKNKMRLEHDIKSLTLRKPPWIPFESRPTNKKVKILPVNKERFTNLLKQIPEDARREYERPSIKRENK